MKLALLGSKPLEVYGPAPTAVIHERLFGEEDVFAFDLATRTEFQGS